MSVESSRQAYVDALGRLLERGSSTPGVNSVAKEAGLNKVLLYRYFGSWEGLLEAFAQRVNPWRDLRIEAETGLEQGRWNDVGAFLKWLFRSYLSRLESDPLLAALLARAAVDRDPVQAALEADREREGLALAALASARFAVPPGALAMVSLLTGGLTWVALMGKKTGTFTGLNFASGGDAFGQLADAADSWVDALTDFQTRASL